MPCREDVQAVLRGDPFGEECRLPANSQPGPQSGATHEGNRLESDSPATVRPSDEHRPSQQTERLQASTAYLQLLPDFRLTDAEMLNVYCFKSLNLWITKRFLAESVIAMGD